MINWIVSKLINKNKSILGSELKDSFNELKNSIDNIMKLQSQLVGLFNNNNFYDMASKSILAPMIIFDKELNIKMCSQIDYKSYFFINSFEHKNLNEIFELKNLSLIKTITNKSVDEKLHKSFFSIENNGSKYFISMTPLSPNGVIEYFNITVYNHNNIFSNQIMVVNFEDQAEFIPNDFASIIYNENNICIYADGFLFKSIGINPKTIINKNILELFSMTKNEELIEKFKRSIDGKIESFTIVDRGCVYICRLSQLLSAYEKPYGTLLIKKI